MGAGLLGARGWVHCWQIHSLPLNVTLSPAGKGCLQGGGTEGAWEGGKDRRNEGGKEGEKEKREGGRKEARGRREERKKGNQTERERRTMPTG